MVLSVLLILVVLAQNPKGGGLSASLGSANQFGGVRETTDIIEKITWSLAIGIVVLSIASSVMGGNGQTEVEQDIQKSQAEQQGQQGTK